MSHQSPVTSPEQAAKVFKDGIAQPGEVAGMVSGYYFEQQIPGATTNTSMAHGLIELTTSTPTVDQERAAFRVENFGVVGWIIDQGVVVQKLKPLPLLEWLNDVAAFGADEQREAVPKVAEAINALLLQDFEKNSGVDATTKPTRRWL